MKRIIILFPIAVYFIFISCYSPGNKIKGNGNVNEETREVYQFEKVDIDGVINVFFIPGSKEQVVVETDENLQSYIHVFNSGKTLIIDTDDDIDFKFAKNNVYITYVTLNEINHDGVGNVKTQGTLRTSSLRLENDGVGGIELEVFCDKFIVKQGGVGSLKLYGEATYFELKSSGVGSVNAYDLKTNYTEVRNSGVGSTEVYSNKEISIHSSGVGSVKYRGDAVITEINNSGIGSIKKQD